MRFNELLLSNYRAFDGPHRLVLRPLTLLYGYNHTGKSALIRALALLAESARGRNPGPLALGSDAGRGAGWEDIKCRQSARRQPLVFGLSGDLPGSETNSTFSLHLAFEQDIEQRRIHTRSITVQLDGHTVLDTALILEASRGRSSLRAQIRGIRGAEGTITLPADLMLEPGALVPDPSAILRAVSNLTQPALGPVLQALSFPGGVLSDLASKTQWLGSIRARPPRRAAFTGAPPDHMDHDGQGAFEILAHDKLAQGTLERRVKSFYEHLSVPGPLLLDVQPQASEVRVVLRPAHNPLVEVDLVDAGEGLAQVFPVLVALARAERAERGDPTLLLLEQPELHLHPRAEQLMGSVLCEVAQRQPAATVVVETHSEMLLLSVFEAILEDRIDPELVGLNWIRQDSQGRSRIDLVSLDELARPGDTWPPNAFEEVAGLAARVALLRAQRSVT